MLDSGQDKLCKDSMCSSERESQAFVTHSLCMFMKSSLARNKGLAALPAKKEPSQNRYSATFATALFEYLLMPHKLSLKALGVSFVQ